MRTARTAVGVALLGLLVLPLRADEPLEAARSLFLNLASRLFVDELDVAGPPAGVEAPWAAKIAWRQAGGRPEWGNVTLGFRADAATGYSFDLLVESATPGSGLNVYLTEADADRWVEAFPLADRVGQGWAHIDLQGDALRLWQFGNGVREPATVGGLTLEPYGKDGALVVWVANLAIHTPAGLRDALSLMADSDCPPPTAVGPVTRLAEVPRCYMGMSLSFLAKPEGQELVAEVRKLVPSLGVAAAGAQWRPEWAEAIARVRADGVDVRVQNGGIAGMAGLITRARAWGVDPQGRSRNTTPGYGDGMHSVSYCHPAAREAVRRMMAAMRGMGILDYEQIDYVWPWQGGPWGYGEWDREAFRTDLLGQDEGLRLASGETVHFTDYLAAYGVDRIGPGDLGIATWDLFEPKAAEGLPEDARRRHSFVFTALTHYEWLKFAQAMGAEARSWGGEFLATLNPEDVSNGGDYVFWSRLRDTGAEYLERFGNPGETEFWRHYLPYLRQEATRSGKRLGVIYEVGVGGHGQPYLDPEVAYCLSYDCTASGGFDDMQNEWMDEAGWAASQEGRHHDRLQQWLATAHAFNQAKADGAALPARRALAIGQRCVVHAIGFSPSYLLTRGALNDLGIDCDYSDLTMDPADWEAYDVLVYTPWESSRRHLEALPRWLDAKPGRMVITHGAVPTRIASGLGYAPSAAVGDPGLGGLLGLGEITVGGAAEGVVSQVSPGLAAALAPGQAPSLPGGLYQTAQGEAVARIGDAALVTRAARPNGSVVYYLNYAAGQPETRQLDGAIVGRLLEQAVCARRASDADRVYCHTFEVAGGHAAVIWSRDACDRFRFEYRDDIEQRMPYRDGTVDVLLRLAVAGGTYRVYDFLADTESVGQAGADGLPVRLSGRTCALLYYGADTPEWQQAVARLKGSWRPG